VALTASVGYEVSTAAWIAAKRTVRPCSEQTPLSGLCKPLGQEHAEDMAERDDLLAWVNSALYEAERAVHNGDAGPRRALSATSR
jgi:hypothetical protein